MKEFFVLFYNRLKKNLLRQILFSNAIGFIIALINILYESKDISSVFIISFIFANSIGLITYTMFVLVSLVWNKERYFQVILLSIFITIISTLFGITLATVLIRIFFNNNFTLFIPGYGKTVFITLSSITLFVTGILMFYSILENRLKQKEAEYERLQKLHIQTKLAMLQSKFNPHFLFNTLNTLLSLVYDSPKDAEKCILNLSDLYRKTFQLGENEFIFIEDELYLIQKYLEIEKIRIGDKLDFDIKVEDDLLKEEIPAFLIEPIVENAVIHGISKVKEGGKVCIDIKKCGNKICISIDNTGASFKNNYNLGFGLYSVSEKLRLIYGGEAHFFIDNFSDKVTKIKLELPYEK